MRNGTVLCRCMVGKMVIVVCTVVILATVSVCFSANRGNVIRWGNETAGARVGVFPLQHTYAINNPVDVGYILDNTGEKPLLFYGSPKVMYTGRAIWSLGRIDVIAPSGEEMQPTHKVSCKHNAVEIQPQEAYEGYIDLAQYFEFKETGEYRVVLNFTPRLTQEGEGEEITVASQPFVLVLEKPVVQGDHDKGRAWAPEQATGTPDTARAGDIQTAWATLQRNQGDEWLELEYISPIKALMVRVHETFNPGAVTNIILKGVDGEIIKKVPVQAEPAPGARWLEVTFEPTSSPVKTVRLEMDTSKVNGWNEIDAVELVGKDKRAWADAARASSTYAETKSGNPTYSAEPEPLTEDIPKAVIITHVDTTAEGMRSIGASGHASQFSRPPGAQFIEAVQIMANRYGPPEPPDEDFHLYILNEEKQVLADVAFPYSTIERSDMKWYTLRTPSVEVPETFYIALAFNPHQTKGIYLGMDKDVERTHSYTGLPRDGYELLEEKADWMLRVALTEKPTGEKSVMRLEDWSPPVKEEPFKECIELAYDDGESDGIQSYGGRGTAVRYNLLDVGTVQAPLQLHGFRIYASRYGSGYDPATTMLTVRVIGTDDRVLKEVTFPYEKFSYKPGWINLVLEEPLEIAPELTFITVGFNPDAHRTKGIYFHFNENPKVSHSYVGTLERGFEPIPEREWMARTYFTKNE